MRMSFAGIWLLAILAMSSSADAGAEGFQALKETADMPGYRPKDGMVPDAKTAIAIAIAVWSPVYGEKEIASEKPYNAVLNNGQWTVTGSLPNGWVGGVATAVISKTDGRVVKIYHSK
jgi:hypothetical protein